MRYRRKMSRRGSRKSFSRNSGYHPANGSHLVMRGGIRF